MCIIYTRINADCKAPEKIFNTCRGKQRKRTITLSSLDAYTPTYIHNLTNPAHSYRQTYKLMPTNKHIHSYTPQALQTNKYTTPQTNLTTPTQPYTYSSA